MPRRLMLTVDVEAQLARADGDHVDRLIWGKFPNGEAGIGKMMDIADEHGAKLSMFLDWSESDIHGDAIKDVGREIDHRGHDLQLHIHTDFFNAEFWSRNNIEQQLDLNILTQEQADVIAGEICARQSEVTGTTPLAFRGGGYRWSEKLLNALARNGVALDSSINMSRATQPVDFAMSRQFRWSNGMIEVPVSNVAKYRNCPRPLDFNFNTSYFPDPAAMYEYLDTFWQERGDDAIAVLVLHSWSLLKLHPDGIFRYDGEHNARRFAKFLKGLKRRVEIVTTKDVLELDRKNALPLDPTVDLALFGEAQQRKQEGSRNPHIPYTASASVLRNAGYTSLSCPICGAAKDRFVKMNGRQCPDCGSVERQRSFALAYDTEIWQRFSLTGRNVLIFSPSVSELRFMKDRGLASKRSADIRLEVKPDIALDMCAMPEIESGSQEFVFASYLMPVVYDMKAALDEVERILAPGGVFISVEPLKEGMPTREISDSDTQSAWYGKETLEKYKVGSYRILGEADYLEQLDRRFTVERFSAKDPITGQINHIHLCWSKNSARQTGARRPTCTICGALVPVSDGPANCSECLSRPRTRTLPEVLVRFVAGRRDGAPLDSILMFNPSGAETRATAFRFAKHQSVSLHGYYGSGHLEGVDIADMPQMASESYSAVSGIGVLEFSADMEAAINECFRVLKQGGIFFTMFSPYRLVDGDAAPSPQGNPVSVGHRSDATQQPYVAGKDWIARAFQKAGFDLCLEKIVDPVTGEAFDWFIGQKPAPKFESVAAVPLESTPLTVSCTICGTDLSDIPASDPNCPKCGARPRTRVFVDIMAKEIKPLVDQAGKFHRPLLAFAMTGMERDILNTAFDSFKSVSLFGKYGSNHDTGVDARDLSRYPEASFSGSFGILVFDYFEEHEQALAEAARVIQDGGVFFHQISTARLVEGNTSPETTSIIQKRPGYFDYVPDEAAMASIKVGIGWFIAAMEKAGFDTRHVNMPDAHTGEANHWFIGIRRPRAAAGNRREARAAARRYETAKLISCAGEKTCHYTPKTYSVPIFGVEGVSRIVLDISIPPLPKSLSSCQFAEHVFDGLAGESTSQVIVTGENLIGVSNDLGDTWSRIELDSSEKLQLHNSFTTRSGNHIIQAIGWLGRDPSHRPVTENGKLFIFSPDWELIGTSKAGDAHWHGSRSISEKNGIIMFADYYDNGAIYLPDFDTSPLRSTVRPCAIWRSKNDGLEWEKVFEQDVPHIRHFHTIMADPFDPNAWWASSGDMAAECHVWKSSDNGDTWIECSDPNPDIATPDAFRSRKAAAHRFTDAAILEDRIIWGCDDYIGDPNDYNDALPIQSRSGARMYSTPKSVPFKIKDVGYIGNPVRSMVDVHNGWIITTEAKREMSGRRAGVFFVDKENNSITRLCDVDNFRNRSTGFTVSRASRKSKDGVFFAFKEYFDLFEGSPRISRFNISYAKS